MSNTDLPDIVNETPALIRWVVQGQLRHLMVGAGTYMLAKGVLPSATVEQEFVNWGINGGLILIGLAWSIMDKKAKTATQGATE